MHVTASHPTGSTGITNQLSLSHPRPRASSKVSHMAIDTDPGIASQHPMVNRHRVPPSTFITGRNHGAISGCILRHPTGSVNIGSHMQAPLSSHRVNSVSKGGSKVHTSLNRGLKNPPGAKTGTAATSISSGNIATLIGVASALSLSILGINLPNPFLSLLLLLFSFR